VQLLWALVGAVVLSPQGPGVLELSEAQARLAKLAQAAALASVEILAQAEFWSSKVVVSLPSVMLTSFFAGDEARYCFRGAAHLQSNNYR